VPRSYLEDNWRYFFQPHVPVFREKLEMSRLKKYYVNCILFAVMQSREREQSSNLLLVFVTIVMVSGPFPRPFMCFEIRPLLRRKEGFDFL
jgi:hypothetical protein